MVVKLRYYNINIKKNKFIIWNFYIDKLLVCLLGYVWVYDRIFFWVNFMIKIKI